MGVFYFIIAFVIVLGFYAYSNNRLRKDFVLAGDSQSEGNLSQEEVKEISYYDKHKVYKDEDGNTINPNSMTRLFVVGNGMSPRINSRDQVIVIKIDKNRPLNEQIKRDDILLIYLEELGIYKLRAFYEFHGQNLLTYYFVGKERRFSTRLYKPESICGIAKFKINNGQVKRDCSIGVEA